MCFKIAEIAVSASDRNPDRLFYRCSCGKFISFVDTVLAKYKSEMMKSEYRTAEFYCAMLEYTNASYYKKATRSLIKRKIVDSTLVKSIIDHKYGSYICEDTKNSLSLDVQNIILELEKSQQHTTATATTSSTFFRTTNSPVNTSQTTNLEDYSKYSPTPQINSNDEWGYIFRQRRYSPAQKPVSNIEMDFPTTSTYQSYQSEMKTPAEVEDGLTVINKNLKMLSLSLNKRLDHLDLKINSISEIGSALHHHDEILKVHKSEIDELKRSTNSIFDELKSLKRLINVDNKRQIIEGDINNEDDEDDSIGLRVKKRKFVSNNEAKECGRVGRGKKNKKK